MRTPLLVGSLGVGAAVLVFALLRSPVTIPSPIESAEPVPAQTAARPDAADRKLLRQRLHKLRAAGIEAAPGRALTDADVQAALSPSVKKALDAMPEAQREKKLEAYRQTLSDKAVLKRVSAHRKLERAALVGARQASWADRAAQAEDAD